MKDIGHMAIRSVKLCRAPEGEYVTLCVVECGASHMDYWFKACLPYCSGWLKHEITKWRFNRKTPSFMHKGSKIAEV